MSSHVATRHGSLSAAAHAVRRLAVDAILKARSGHVGLPLGCAEVGSLLYGRILKHDPAHPDWPDRDRFVLSAGHGSMLLYSLLHLAGYDLSLDDLRAFRTLGSRTPGHPEHGVTPGVETTTGPLGQGFANAVGMAIAERRLAHEFNTPDATLVDHRTYVLAGDGDLMEGVSYEAASLAAHLKLGKLIVFFDSNQITIDGSTSLSFSEDVPARFRAVGWQTLEADAYDEVSVMRAVAEAQAEDTKPSLIRVRSTIGVGLPRVEGTAAAHGGPLEEGDAAAIRADGEDVAFHVDPAAYEFFAPATAAGATHYERWQGVLDSLKTAAPHRYAEWQARHESVALTVPEIDTPPALGSPIATRVAGGALLQRIHDANPHLIGGSADLTVPCFGPSLDLQPFTADTPGGWFISYGIREHAMGSVSNGIALHGGLRTFCGTFLAFSDYMRPALRLAALMDLPVIFVLTHDSVRIGEDGPTHQPVEHIASLRAMPGLTVLRPADALETQAAWRFAAEHVDGPTVLLLTRQNVSVFQRESPDWHDHFASGAYVVYGADTDPELVLVATGSEVPEALDAARAVRGRRVRVVSMPCRERFLRRPEEYRSRVIPPDVPVLVVEAGATLGWHELTRAPIRIIGIDRFGASGPGGDVAAHFGFTAESIRTVVEEMLGARTSQLE